MIGGYHRPDRSAFVAIGLTVISFLLMTFDIRSSQSGVAETLRNGAQTVAAPIQRLVNAIVDPVVDFGDGLANLANLRAENERLRVDLEEARRQAASVAVLEAQIEQLRILQGLQLSDNLDDILIPAELTARGGTLELSFTIDKGRADGVLEGHPVIDLQGALIGVVSAVTDTTATVIPITARSGRPSVTVRVGDTDEVGAVSGQGTNMLLLEVFEAVQPVEQGQLVRTLGSDRFPRDLDIGIVVEDAVPLAQVVRVQVEPLVDFDRIRFVGVIPWPPEQFDVDEPNPANESRTPIGPEDQGEEPADGIGEVSQDVT
ncbi:MAG: rod shape-determining protein MreC, partial [Acidimicrobiia bacterium]|nr:rod shape-determining protein MreC [Acidimicrobiia bacterium]